MLKHRVNYGTPLQHSIFLVQYSIFSWGRMYNYSNKNGKYGKTADLLRFKHLCHLSAKLAFDHFFAYDDHILESFGLADTVTDDHGFVHT